MIAGLQRWSDIQVGDYQRRDGVQQCFSAGGARPKLVAWQICFDRDTDSQGRDGDNAKYK